MDQLAATIGDACTKAMQGLETRLHDQEKSHDAAIELFQNRFSELRRLLTEQGRRVRILEEENGALRESRQSQPPPASQTNQQHLQRKLDQLVQSSVEQATRLASLETWKNIHLGREDAAHARIQQHDESLAVLQSSVLPVNTTLQNAEARSSELQEELLTITRTLLGVIKVMRGTEEQERAETVSQLQEKIEAVLSPQRPVASKSLAQDAPMPGTISVQHFTDAESDRNKSLNMEDTVQDSIEPANATADECIHSGATTRPSRASEPEAAVETPGEAPKSKRKNFPSQDGHCHDCSRTESSMRRGGPNGPRTLCNGCGLKWSRSRRREEANEGSLAMAVNQSTAAREDLIASTATFGTQEQMDMRIQEIADRTIRRKPALSTLKGRFEQSPSDVVATSKDHTPPSEISSTKGPEVLSPGYDAATATGLASRSPSMDTKSIYSIMSGDKADSISSNGVPAKRKRLNADEKARRLANEFFAENGSEEGRKKRRTVATKTVRFDIGEDDEDQEDEMEIGGKNNPPTTATASADRGNQQEAARPLVEDKRVVAAAVDTEIAGLKMAAPPRPTKMRGGNGGRKQQQAARVALADINKNSKGKPRTKTSSKSAPEVQATAFKLTENERVDEGMDSSEDTIVVSRPGKAVAQSPEAAPTASSERTAAAVEVKKTAGRNIDMLGSEDELALPSRPRPEASRPSGYAEASGSEASLKTATSDTYRSLLSQFNLQHDGRPTDQGADTIIPTTEVEGRPKRQPKPRKFDDVVDVRTLSKEVLNRRC